MPCRSDLLAAAELDLPRLPNLCTDGEVKAARRLIAAMAEAGVEPVSRQLLTLVGKTATPATKSAPVTIASFPC